MSGSSNDSQKSVPVGEFYFNVFRVIVMQGNNIQVKTSSLSFYFLGLYYLGLVLNGKTSVSASHVEKICSKIGIFLNANFFNILIFFLILKKILI